VVANSSDCGDALNTGYTTEVLELTIPTPEAKVTLARRGAALDGKVIDDRGRPGPNARVTVNYAGSALSNTAGLVQFRNMPYGRPLGIKVTALPEGTRYVTRPEARASTTLEDERSDLVQLTVVRQGRLFVAIDPSLHTVSPSILPLELEFIPEKGENVTHGIRLLLENFNSPGEVWLGPGEYLVRPVGSLVYRVPLRHESVVVSSGAAHPVTIGPVNGAYGLDGRVVDGQGVGVASAKVAAMCLSDMQMDTFRADTDATGRFRLSGMDPGKWLLFVNVVQMPGNWAFYGVPSADVHDRAAAAP